MANASSTSALFALVCIFVPLISIIEQTNAQTYDKKGITGTAVPVDCTAQCVSRLGQRQDLQVLPFSSATESCEQQGCADPSTCVNGVTITPKGYSTLCLYFRGVVNQLAKCCCYWPAGVGPASAQPPPGIASSYSYPPPYGYQSHGYGMDYSSASKNRPYY